VEDVQYNIQFDLLATDDANTKSTPIGSISANGYSGSNGQMYPVPGVTDIHLVEFDGSTIQAPLVDLFSEALEQGRREEARALLLEVLPGATNVEIGTYKNVPPRLVVVYPDRGVPLALAGDGILSLARMCLELAVRPGGVVLLEEPEVHQHPGAIHQSAKAIFAAVRREVQIVLSTHSLDLIDALLSEVQSDEELTKLAVYSLRLENGCLKHYRVAGPDVAFQRVQIGDDLR
jgi:hypothetical protein